MSGHTPGPWEVSEEQMDRGRWDIVETRLGDTGGIIAQAAHHPNALLIAAGPEMLDILKEVRQAKESGRVHAERGWPESVFVRVDRLIEKLSIKSDTKS